LLALLLWACLAPLRQANREKLLDLGTPSGSALRLTLGVSDVLLLTNSSRSSQVFGQLRILPGHAFRLPFEQPGAFSFACTNAFGGQVQVEVVAPPDPGLARLRWRADDLIESVRTMQFIAPTRI
jgi:hypothetical protein